MPIDVTKIKECIRQFNFKKLFIEELGWDHHEGGLDIIVDEVAFTLSAIAHKRGMVVYICVYKEDIPAYPLRRKIENKTARSVQEHLIIYIDPKQNRQIWQWVKREPGKPAACREHHYYAHQPGDSLAQKVSAIAFSLEEEEGLTIVDITGRVRAGFDVDRLTKRFYDRFKKEHAAFLKFIEGIPDTHLQRWYASVMLNRLMFIYFIQKKRFLNNDTDYLRNKLGQTKEKGKNHFYKDFLCPLFFEGFAKQESERDSKVNELLGNVPYLNGGIFQQHEIEQLHGKTINLVDKAFEKIFNFFDAYQWHLDEHPLRADNEINPDVLGYIFEKYINQKQMGAYYTKEDITGYISRNTVIPRIFDIAKKKCKIAFEGEQSLWRLLRENPDRYIFGAVKKGVDLRLPEEITVGLNDVSKRTEWNKPAPEEYALPTEIWREVVARRQCHDEVHLKLVNGEISSINDFITCNLDICQFAQDVIENCEGPELLRIIWYAIAGRIPEKSNERFQAGISILDPACGSGAFLFAALNILESLYEACLDRMQVFLDELDHSDTKHYPEKFGDFRKILAEVDKHTNRSYFVYKSIIINNLFGVDIIEEGVEICKLRLFLKLVAQVENVENIEPLPDIDFNIRVGNALVGFAIIEEVKKSMQGDFLKLAELPEIEENAATTDRAFQIFRQMQTREHLDPSQFGSAKSDLRKKLTLLEERLDSYLAGVYGIDSMKKAAYNKWLQSHQLFHWFVDFYGIIRTGGFDVIIGNPPYVEYAKVKSQYKVKGYQTEKCGNLYAFFAEKGARLLRKHGRLGLIIPVASVCTGGYAPLQNILTNSGDLIISNFNDRPGKLFEGLEHIRLSIVLYEKNGEHRANVFTTRYNKWNTAARGTLFEVLRYTNSKDFVVEGSIPKLCSDTDKSILHKLLEEQQTLGTQASSTGRNCIYYTRKLSGFVQVLDFVPEIHNEIGDLREPSELKSILFNTEAQRNVFLAVLNSSLFFWFVTVYSDCRNLNKREVNSMPFDFDAASAQMKDELVRLSQALMQDYLQNSKVQELNYKKLGRLQIQCIYPKKSKPLIDLIDRALAKHYGFFDEEVDYIINYDIKYRMGREAREEDE